MTPDHDFGSSAAPDHGCAGMTGRIVAPVVSRVAAPGATPLQLSSSIDAKADRDRQKRAIAPESGPNRRLCGSIGLVPPAGNHNLPCCWTLVRPRAMICLS